MNLFLLLDIRISTCLVPPISLVESRFIISIHIMSAFPIAKYSFHFLNFLSIDRIFNFIKLYSQYIEEFHLCFPMIVRILCFKFDIIFTNQNP